MTARPPGMPEPTLTLSIPPDGIADGDLVLRLPRPQDVDAIARRSRIRSCARRGTCRSSAATSSRSRFRTARARSLGIARVEAYVNVGNHASDRVLERAGFTSEGVVRSLPKPDGARVDKTLYSLLPGE